MKKPSKWKVMLGFILKIETILAVVVGIWNKDIYTFGGNVDSHVGLTILILGSVSSIPIGIYIYRQSILLYKRMKCEDFYRKEINSQYVKDYILKDLTVQEGFVLKDISGEKRIADYLDGLYIKGRDTLGEDFDMGITKRIHDSYYKYFIDIYRNKNQDNEHPTD